MPEIVAALIGRVEVGQAQKADGVKKQEIKIIYNFIGNIKEQGFAENGSAELDFIPMLAG